MKFSQKIFLITFAFVTISINLIGIIIINNNYNMQINSRIENNISNLHNIVNILRFYNKSGINENLFDKDNTCYEISEDENIIYSNLLFNMNEVKNKITPTNENIKAIISNEVLFMSVKQDNYNIILAEDIKDIFNIRKEQIYFFIKVSIIFSFIIAFCLYITIFLLTRKIKKLNKAVKHISEGDYSARVQNLGTDEIGNLAKSFNKMAYSIDKTISEIQRVSENRKNFINNITHEIRTPLTSIIGYSSLIKSEKITQKEKIIEYNNKIYEEGNYLNLISQRLIDIVLLDNKKIELEYIDISEIINGIIENIRNDYKDISFVQGIQSNITILSDEVLLHSLILNIVKNAITAYEKEEKKVVIITLEKVNENKILLRIIDKGKGMSEEQLKKVIEPFYTSNADRNRKLSGMGLGLPLCKKICEILNATLKIESELGEGTCVNIEFTI